VPASPPLSEAPYALENRLVMQEVFLFCPEWSDHFLPFVSMDPGRAIGGQIAALDLLTEEYPLYGVKISPIFCQSPITALLSEGRPLVEWAAERNLGFLLHISADPDEAYSQVRTTFDLTQEFPEVRFCLAHCAAFDKRVLEASSAAPNVWVDTAALKIQVQAALENNPAMAAPADRFESDYTDHRRVLADLAEAYPDTIVWGSDSPAYSYICRRKQAEGHWLDFRLKGSYEDEVAALDSLNSELRQRVGGESALDFIFGRSGD
jgi:predicted TIM-barrel fold metal-dependent hydrolase